MTVFVSAVGKPGVRMPPPCSVIAAVPLSTFAMTREFTSVSGESGPPKSWPFQMPAPWAKPRPAGRRAAVALDADVREDELSVVGDADALDRLAAPMLLVQGERASRW
jgi:hypothetical protein